MRGLATILLLCISETATAADALPPGAMLRLGETRYRAGGEIRQLRFSPDGTVVCGWALGPDGELHAVAWETLTGEAVPHPGPLSPPETPARATPAARLGGDRVVTAGPGCAGRIWDAGTARQLALLRGHSAPVTAVAVSVDGARIATGSADGLVKLWDAATFHPLNTLAGHTSSIRTVRTSANGRRAVTIGDDGSARVWDLRTGRELRGFQTTQPADLSPDGQFVALAVGGRLAVRDLVTGLEVVPPSPPSRPAFTLSELFGRVGVVAAYAPDGRMLAVAHRDGTISLYEAATGEERRVLVGHGAQCHGLTFTPDGGRLLSAGADHTVLVWPVSVRDLPLPAAIQQETRAGILWTTMTTGNAGLSYLAMARFAVEPAAAVKMARLRLAPAESAEIDAQAVLADTRGVELLEALGTPAAREFLQELAAGEVSAHRTQEARRALVRLR